MGGIILEQDEKKSPNGELIENVNNEEISSTELIIGEKETALDANITATSSFDESTAQKTALEAELANESSKINTTAENMSLDKVKKSFKFEVPIEELYDKNGDVKTLDENKEIEQVEENPLPDKKAKKAKKRERTKRRGCLNAIIYTILILALSVTIAFFGLSAAADMLGIGKTDSRVDVTIPAGASTLEIATILKKESVINNDYAFRIYVKLKKESGFKEGTYTLNSNMGYDDIISILKNPAKNKLLVHVTIPEGKTMQQIGLILEKAGVCTQQEFLTDVETQLGGYKFANDALIPKNKEGRFYRYEGYLFPDTYDMYQGSTGKSAAQKMFTNFDKKFDATLSARAVEIGMTTDEVITLASIIQAEAGNIKEMSKVSSVFHNRLTNGVKENGNRKLLQSDVTIFYGKRDITTALQQLSQADTKIASAYNTYINEGLPPGPICNPGLDAINAALSLEPSNNYYFVSDPNGVYYYAETYTIHQANVKKAMKIGTARGTNVYK